MATQEIKVPDLGGASGVEVIEVHVKAGDQIALEDALITLESEKAAIDVPSSAAGTVKEVKVKEGDKVSQGDVILMLESEEKQTEEIDNKNKETDSKPQEESHQEQKEEKTDKRETDASASSETVEFKVPDLGGAEQVEVIELQVNEGDQVNIDDPIATLESEKAAIDVPCTIAGTIEKLKIKAGDKVSKGDVLALIRTSSKTTKQKEEKQTKAPTDQDKKTQEGASEKAAPSKVEAKSSEEKTTTPAMHTNVYAGPAVRRLARELDVNLNEVKGSGDKGRITKADIKRHLSGGAEGGLGLPQPPVVDFESFGEVERQPLTRINKLTAKNMSRNWLLVPHVTQFDEADITEMEAFRQTNKKEAEKEGFKLTPLVFIMKAVVAGLKAFPKFNASLDPGGEQLILKKYFHVGIAVDTPNGLVVPVIRDVDQKGLFDLAKELSEVSKKAREGKLSPKDMQGGCFTISSLGGIGGTAFTPIVNVPEVAILGVSKAQKKPIYQGEMFEPRLMLPLSLSYDHRVIDGADGARFVTYLSQCLADIRKLLL